MASCWVWTQDWIEGPWVWARLRPREEHRDVWQWPACPPACLHLAFCSCPNPLRDLSDTLVPPGAHIVFVHTHYTLPRFPRWQPPWNSWCSRNFTGECQYTLVHGSPQLPAWTKPLPPSQWLCWKRSLYRLGLLLANVLLAVLSPTCDHVRYDMRRGYGLDDFWGPGWPSRVGD